MELKKLRVRVNFTLMLWLMVALAGTALAADDCDLGTARMRQNAYLVDTMDWYYKVRPLH